MADNDNDEFKSYKIEAGEIGQIRQWREDETPEHGQYFVLVERDVKGPVTFWRVKFLKDSRIVGYGERYVLGSSKIVKG